jgi:hypothetical protein
MRSTHPVTWDQAPGCVVTRARHPSAPSTHKRARFGYDSPPGEPQAPAIACAIFSATAMIVSVGL